MLASHSQAGRGNAPAGGSLGRRLLRGLLGLLGLFLLGLFLLGLGRLLGRRFGRGLGRLFGLGALQAGGVGGLGQGLDAAVELVVAAVEGGQGNALGGGGGGQRLADGRGRLDVTAVGRAGANVLGARRRCNQGDAADVVDELGVNVLGAAVDAQARPLGRAGDPAADVPAAPELSFAFGLLVVHVSFPISLLNSAPPGQARWWRSGGLAAAGEGLAFLAPDDLVFVANALALVRLGLAHVADVGGELADLLLVGALDDDGVGVGHLDGDALRRLERDRVGVADDQGEALLVGPGLVA